MLCPDIHVANESSEFSAIAISPARAAPSPLTDNAPTQQRHPSIIALSPPRNWRRHTLHPPACTHLAYETRVWRARLSARPSPPPPPISPLATPPTTPAGSATTSVRRAASTSSTATTCFSRTTTTNSNCRCFLPRHPSSVWLARRLRVTPSTSPPRARAHTRRETNSPT